MRTYNCYLLSLWTNVIIASSALLSVGCNASRQKVTTFWETQKGDFKYQSRNEFLIVDSILSREMKTMRRLKHKSIDSIFSKKVYLYSWEVSSVSENRFTVVLDDGELGLKIYYLILDKQDQLISATQLAGQSKEAYYIFETSSKVISEDSIWKTESVTQWMDPITGATVIRPKGDTTWSWIVIDSGGKVSESLVRETKSLNYSSP